MRSVLLVVAILAMLFRTLAYPFAGVILWTWFTLQQPQEDAYSFAPLLPLNLVIAVVAAGAWLLSSEPKAPPRQFLVWVVAIFLAWMTFNSFFAFDPAWSWPHWNRTWKTFALGLMIIVLATNQVRIHAIIAACVLSLFYYSIKGGLFTILTGGVNHVLGPARSEIHDNNALALAVMTTIPLAVYLRRQSANPWVSRGLAAAIVVTIVSVVGSYSRGALVGLAAFALFWIVRSRRKSLYLGMVLVGTVAVLSFMPERFLERAATIKSIQQGGYDASFHGRVVAWQVAFNYARDHFPFGAGFYAPQLGPIYNHYFPGEKTHAAHSIYFQVLGEHGFVGLFLYLLIILVVFWKCSRVIKQTRHRPEFAWAGDLAQMIQMSMLVFCVVGAALSMAYYDLFVILVALTIVVTKICAVPRASPMQTRRVIQRPQTVAS